MSLDLPILDWRDGSGNTLAGGGPHVPVPQKPHLFTYTQPVFGPNSASFYGLVMPVSIGRRAIVGVPIFVSPFETDTTTLAVTCDFAVSLGYPGADTDDIIETQVLRIWADGVLIYDALAATGWNTGSGINFRVYKGLEDQMPDPRLVEWLGDDEGIAFRGQLYIMFYDFPLTALGMSRVPFVRVEVRDSYAVAAQINDVIRIGSATPLSYVGLDLAVDWTLNRVYALDNTATILHTYDMTNMVEIASVTVAASGGIANFQGSFYGDQRYGYVIGNIGGLANSTPHGCVDPMTGATLGSFGSSGISVSDSPTGFATSWAINECTINGIDMVQSLIVCLGQSFGPVGVMTLSAAGALGYAWHTGSVYTIFDIFTGMTSAPKFVCPGDLVPIGQVGTAFVASLNELNRLVISARGDGNWQGRMDRVWFPPTGHHIEWIFLEPVSSDCIVIHADMTTNLQYFSRVHLIDTLRNLAEPTPGTSGSTTGYSTTIYQAGPIPNVINNGSPTGFGTTGAVNAALAAESGYGVMFPGWNYSRIGSTQTIGYHAAYNDEFTLLNIADGSWSTFELRDWVDNTGTLHDVSASAGSFTANLNHIWDGNGEFFIGFGDIGATGAASFGPAKVFPMIPPGGDVPLYQILTWLMQYAGFDDADVEVDGALNDEFTGALVVEQGLSVWDMLADMAKALQFEVFESEGFVKMVKVLRGASLSISVTLDPDDDLLAIGDSDDDGKGNNDQQVSATTDTSSGTTATESAYAVFMTTRDWTQDVPQSIELHYLDETNDYTVNIARSTKTTFPIETTQNDNTERVDVPIIMTPQKAMSYAAKALYDMYAGQCQHEFRLGSQYLNLEPGAVISLTIGSQDYTMKLIEGTMNTDWSMSCRASSFTSNIDSIAVTGEDVLAIQESVIGPSISQGFVIDTPPLTPTDAFAVNDSLLRYYSEVSSYGQNGWVGGRLLTADAITGPFTEIYRTTITGAFVGIASSVLSGALAYSTDYISSLAVTFIGHPETITAAAGYMLVGKPGRWEYMYYETMAPTSTGVGNRSYTFSTLTRGLQGTEWHTGDHAAGDTVLFYPDVGGVVLSSLPLAKTSGTVYYKAVGNNMGENTAPVQQFTIAKNFEKPWAPTSLKATTISGGSSGLTLSWMRRTRLFWPLGATGTMPIEPGWTEGYEIDILSGPSGSVLRTVTGVATSSYTYASGNVTTDFGSRPATISFNVYQISPVVGRGFAGSITTDVVSAT